MDCICVAMEFYVSNPFFNKFIIIYYNIEMIIKLLAFGFFLEYDSYFRDKWNTFDFLLNCVLDIYHAVIWSTDSDIEIPFFDFLRFFKIFKIPPIQIILIKIASTLWLLAETFTIVVWFILFYAIWGLQLYSGLMKHICIDSITGLQLRAQIFCGNGDFLCLSEEICSKSITNPDYGVSNYDNLLSACLQVFKIITGDDWTSSMFIIQKTFTKFVWIYFVSLVVFGNFFMMNLILAVLKVKYGQNDMKFQTIRQKTKRKVYDLKELRAKRIIMSKYKKNTKRIKETTIPKIITDTKLIQNTMENSNESLNQKVFL